MKRHTMADGEIGGPAPAPAAASPGVAPPLE